MGGLCEAPIGAQDPVAPEGLTPGSHGTVRDSLPSHGSCHLDYQRVVDPFPVREGAGVEHCEALPGSACCPAGPVPAVLLADPAHQVGVDTRQQVCQRRGVGRTYAGSFTTLAWVDAPDEARMPPPNGDAFAAQWKALGRSEAGPLRPRTDPRPRPLVRRQPIGRDHVEQSPTLMAIPRTLDRVYSRDMPTGSTSSPSSQGPAPAPSTLTNVPHRPIYIAIAAFACLILLYVLLDLAGRTYPLFAIQKWGTFADWTLALATPGAIIASYLSWMQDRRDRHKESIANDRRITESQALDAKQRLANVRLVTGQGVRGRVTILQNGSNYLVSILRHASTSNGPIVVEALDQAVLPNDVDASNVHIWALGRRFSVTEAGVDEVQE